MVKHLPHGANKTVVVPIAHEEKFVHDPNFFLEEKQLGGTGNEKEGDVLGEESLHEVGDQSGSDGQGEATEHEMEDLARQMSKLLVENLGLPNLQDKGMRPSLTKYTYDLTDRHVGSGQFLDKMATLKNIVKTNVALGKIDLNNINPSEFLISPQDKVFRVVSREKEYESQAKIFFLRDYSGSMSGRRTEVVCNIHFLFYSWLLSQYHDRIEKYYILHDTSAKEVPDFYTYANSKVAGGTRISEAYQLVNKMIVDENMVENYNIYVFHGTDGDDWDTEGKETIPHIQETLSYVNRLGITVVHEKRTDPLSKYLEKANMFAKNQKTLRLAQVSENASDSEMIENMKHLVSED